MIFRLKQNRIAGNRLKLSESYLQKNRVVLNGLHSDYSVIKSGVPQGSVLGPLLFLVYINYPERNIKSHVNFFADHTMLFSIINDPIVSANNLNHDLDIIYQWAHQWKTEFNPDFKKQASEVTFSCKKMKPNHPLLVFNGSAVAQVNEQKHLVLILESDLSFEKHLNEIMIEAKNNIGFLKNLSKFLPLKTLHQMYKALARFHLDYCDIIYHIPPIGLSLYASKWKEFNTKQRLLLQVHDRVLVAVNFTWKPYPIVV